MRETLTEIREEEGGGGAVEAKARLEPERAPQREREAEELRDQRDGGNHRYTEPGLGEPGTAPQAIHERDTAADREHEKDRRIHHRADTPEAQLGDRVVGRLAVLLRRDTGGKGSGHLATMLRDRRRLALREPEVEGDAGQHGEDENAREPVHVTV